MKALLLLSVLLMSFAASADIIGDHKGEEMASGDACSVSITKDKHKLLVIVKTDKEAIIVPALSAAAVNDGLNNGENYSEIFEKRITFIKVEGIQVTIDVLGEELNFVTAIRSVTKRFCTYNCETERTQIICSIRK